MRDFTSVLTKCVVVSSVVLLGACGEAEPAPDPVDVPVEVLERGAAPGGMTGEWTSEEGETLELGDDGKAVFERDGRGTDCVWRQIDQSTGELYSNDGTSMRLTLSGDTLLVEEMVPETGEWNDIATLGRRE